MKARGGHPYKNVQVDETQERAPFVHATYRIKLVFSEKWKLEVGPSFDYRIHQLAIRFFLFVVIETEFRPKETKRPHIAFELISVKYHMSHLYWAYFSTCMYSKRQKMQTKKQPEYINEYRSRFPSTGPGTQVQILNNEINKFFDMS